MLFFKWHSLSGPSKPSVVFPRLDKIAEKPNLPNFGMCVVPWKKVEIAVHKSHMLQCYGRKDFAFKPKSLLRKLQKKGWTYFISPANLLADRVAAFCKPVCPEMRALFKRREINWSTSNVLHPFHYERIELANSKRLTWSSNMRADRNPKCLKQLYTKLQ